EQFCAVSPARGDGLAVLAEHRAKTDVGQFDVLDAPSPGGLEQIAEVQPLTEIDDREDRVRLEFVEPMLDRGQGRTGLGKSSIQLWDEADVLFIEPDNDGPLIAWFCDFLLKQAFHDRGQHWIVKALAVLVIKRENAELFINVMNFRKAVRDEFLPQSDVL